MSDAASTNAWAEGFPDLSGHPERYVLCEGRVGFCVVDGVAKDGGPGVVIRLKLPDGRAALAGMDLLQLIDGSLEGADQCGYRPILGLAQSNRTPLAGEGSPSTN